MASFTSVLRIPIASMRSTRRLEGSNAKSDPIFHSFLDMTLYLYRAFSVGAILSSPAIDHNTLYFGSSDGKVYALH